MAVLNEWGGRDFRAKSEELAASILSWFSDAKNELYIDDLEVLVEENMIGFFNVEIDDGSIEECTCSFVKKSEKFLHWPVAASLVLFLQSWAICHFSHTYCLIQIS